MRQLVALHKHWCTADAVKVAVGFAPTGETGLSDEFEALAKLHSVFLRITVWYALLYVVIEGYRELGNGNDRVDELLANEEMVEGIRRFRNAVFHFQEDPVGPKLMGFLNAHESELWACSVHVAFGKFFEQELPINEYLADMRDPGDT